MKLRPVNKMDSGWNQLQLPAGHGDVIESLIERHFRNKDFNTKHNDLNLDFDFIQGKGKLYKGPAT